MCFGGGDNSANDIAQQDRADEVARQGRITSGMQKINNVFNGTTTGDGVATGAYDPTKTYYNADGSAYSSTPSAGSGSGLGGLFGGAPAQTPQSLINSGQLYTGTKTTGGFGDDFYNGQKQAYLDYADPQIDHQYGLAKDQTVYALDRSGLLDSLAGQKQNAELSTTNDQARLDAANEGQNVENQARSNVESTRSNLVAQLNATGDDQAAADAATRSAQSLYQPQGFSPLGNAFASFTSGLSNIGANSGNQYSGLINMLPTLFGGKSGASSTVVSGA